MQGASRRPWRVAGAQVPAVVAALLVLGAPARAAQDESRADKDAPSAQVRQGSYLVHRVAMCVQCHSARDKSGELLDRDLLKGAALPVSSPFPYQVWAFRAPPLAGLPTGYTEDDVVTLLTQGRKRTGVPPMHPMPPYRMTERDAKAVAAYLKWVGGQPDVRDVSEQHEAAVERAAAVLQPTQGSKVSGSITFTRRENFVYIRADVSGLTPGLHGLHITENGDCSAPDASSAGEHFNPDNRPHGAPNEGLQHLGDLGNLVADERGVAHYERMDARLAFDGDHSIVGRGVVVDEHWDDLQTQPDGNSGAHVACGVIRRY